MTGNHSPFIPYDLRLLLDKTDFNFDNKFEGIYARYHNDTENVLPWGMNEWNTCGHTEVWSLLDVEAPMWSDVTDWLRECHNTHIIIDTVDANGRLLYVYYHKEMLPSHDFCDALRKEEYTVEAFPTYYGALYAAVKEAIIKVTPKLN